MSEEKQNEAHLSVLKGKFWANIKLLHPRTEIDWKQLNSDDKIFQEMIVAVSKVYGLELPSEITREVLADLLSKIDVPESAKRNKRKRKVLFETGSTSETKKKKEDDDWLYDDAHEELLRSRDDD